MYVLIALAVTILVIALAWRGLGARIEAEERRGESFGGSTPPPRPAPQPKRPPKIVAPDDDPDFLREIDRKLKDGRDTDPGAGPTPV